MGQEHNGPGLGIRFLSQRTGLVLHAQKGSVEIHQIQLFHLLKCHFITGELPKIKLLPNTTSRTEVILGELENRVTNSALGDYCC